MKVLLVTESFVLSKGGAERSAYELARCLSEAGLEVTVLAGKINFDQEKDLSFRLESVGVSGGSKMSYWRRFRQGVADHLRKNDYDVVHSLVPLAAADVYQPRGGSVLYSARRHCLSYETGFMRRFKQATKGLNRARQSRIRAEAELCWGGDGPMVAALSEYVAGQFKDEYNLPSERLRIIRNGIDVDRCNMAEAQGAGKKLRKQFDRNGDLALFIFAAQNPRLKGLSHLIRAGRLVMEQRISERDFRILVFCGWEYERYWRQANQLGLNERVIFMGATERLAAMLHACDGVVLPSFNDACSRVILEGLAAGKPGITTRYNGAAEFLGEGKYGFVVEDGDDVKGLAEAVLAICDQRRHQEMYEAIEKDKVVERVSIRRHVSELVALYGEIVGKK